MVATEREVAAQRIKFCRPRFIFGGPGWSRDCDGPAEVVERPTEGVAPGGVAVLTGRGPAAAHHHARSADTRQATRVVNPGRDARAMTLAPVNSGFDAGVSRGSAIRSMLRTIVGFFRPSPNAKRDSVLPYRWASKPLSRREGSRSTDMGRVRDPCAGSRPSIAWPSGDTPLLRRSVTRVVTANHRSNHWLAQRRRRATSTVTLMTCAHSSRRRPERSRSGALDDRAQLRLQVARTPRTRSGVSVDEPAAMTTTLFN